MRSSERSVRLDLSKLTTFKATPVLGVGLCNVGLYKFEKKKIPNLRFVAWKSHAMLPRDQISIKKDYSVIFLILTVSCSNFSCNPQNKISECI